MAGWTTKDIPALRGRVALVTGANSGIGLETAAELAGAGAEVILGCRDLERGAQAAGTIRLRFPDASVEPARLDLAELKSVREFASAFGRAHDRLDILVNNAGVMAVPQGETADGFELQFGTNHLGHFALTGGLLELLLAGPGARVVTVSSLAALLGTATWDDAPRPRRYNRWLAYGRSKLANQLFAFELDRRAKAAGAALVSVASHPGYSATNITTSSGAIPAQIGHLGNRLLAQPAAAGALPSLYAATYPELAGGEFVGPASFFGARGLPKVVRPIPAARDRASAARLWERSVELTGEHFDALG